MSERPPEGGEVGRQGDLRKFSDLPHYYQCLGRACEAAGLLAEFYGTVEAGLEYGQALTSLRHELNQAEKVDNVDEFLEHFGIPSAYDEYS